MDKTDLSLILSAFGVLLGLGPGITAAVITIAFITGLLVGRTTRIGPDG